MIYTADEFKAVYPQTAELIRLISFDNDMTTKDAFEVDPETIRNIENLAAGMSKADLENFAIGSEDDREPYLFAYPTLKPLDEWLDRVFDGDMSKVFYAL